MLKQATTICICAHTHLEALSVVEGPTLTPKPKPKPKPKPNLEALSVVEGPATVRNGACVRRLGGCLVGVRVRLGLGLRLG